MITVEQLKEISPSARVDILEAIINNLEVLDEYYEISTPLRLAHFLAQTCHESGGFRLIEENLNYRAESLTKVFPKYFKTRDPSEYARNPEKIANVVYASRMGNGPTESGDGYSFRGRGLIQLTGRNNYTSFATDTEMTVLGIA